MHKTGAPAQKEKSLLQVASGTASGQRSRKTHNFETRTSPRTFCRHSDMIKLLFLLSFTTVLKQSRILGKPVHGDLSSMLKSGFSDPPAEWQKKRNSYYATQDPEEPNLADPTSLCYFIQESETESQISCRLRFTRSKFNFNSFGLRFGKRQGSPLAEDRQRASLNRGKIMDTLLKPNLERRLAGCEDSSEDNC